VRINTYFVIGVVFGAVSGWYGLFDNLGGALGCGVFWGVLYILADAVREYHLELKAKEMADAQRLLPDQQPAKTDPAKQVIKFKCARCHEKLRVTGLVLPVKVKCPKCGVSLRLPPMALCSVDT